MMDAKVIGFALELGMEGDWPPLLKRRVWRLNGALMALTMKGSYGGALAAAGAAPMPPYNAPPGTCSRILPCFGAFIPLGTAKTVRFGVQHGVQCLFHRATNDLSQMLLNLPLINMNHLAQHRYFLACFSLVGGLHRPPQALSFTNQTHSSSNVRKEPALSQ